LALLLLSGVIGCGQARAQGDPCTGDCDRDGFVTVSELISGVGSALRGSAAGTCDPLDANGNGGIEVDELVAAVHNSFTECGRLGTTDVALARLAAGDLRAARAFFAAARASDPTDHRSQLLAAILGPVNAALGSDELRDIAERSGLTITGDVRDACSLAFDAAREVPEGAPRTGAIVEAVRGVLIPALNDSLQRIESIDDAAVIRFDPADFPECASLSIAEPFEIDHGDLLALQGGIEAALAALDLATAYDFDFDLKQALEAPLRDVLEAEPGLLALASRDRLTSARDLLASALDDLGAAIDSIQSEKDGQDDDFVVILSEDAEDAAKVRRMIDRGRQSLFAEARVPIDIVSGKVFLTDDKQSPSERLNLAPFFSGTFAEVRQFLPAFDEKGNFDAGRFPDPTFAGGAPDLTQQDIDDFLRDANFRAVDDFVDSSDFFPDDRIIIVVP
jgi:hypothetical protein